MHHDHSYVFAACRLLEVLVQHRPAAERVHAADGVSQLVRCVVKHADKESIGKLTIPALGALKHLLLALPQAMMQPLSQEATRGVNTRGARV